MPEPFDGTQINDILTFVRHHETADTGMINAVFGALGIECARRMEAKGLLVRVGSEESLPHVWTVGKREMSLDEIEQSIRQRMAEFTETLVSDVRAIVVTPAEFNPTTGEGSNEESGQGL